MPMAQNKKILLNLSEGTVSSLDALAAENGVSRTDLIRRAVTEYVEQAEKQKLRAQLKDGYVQMGEINLSLAEMCFEADTAAWEKGEENLAESE